VSAAGGGAGGPPAGRSPRGPGSNTEKLRPAREIHPSSEARSVERGSLAAGRAADAQGWSAKRRSEHALHGLGLPTALDLAREADAAGEHATAARLHEWLDLDPRGIARLVAPGRQLRLSMCGVAFVIRRSGAVGYLRRGCKDRVCPTCSARRSRMIAARVKEHVSRLLRRYVYASRRGRRVEPIWSVTFTRRKVATETPRQAIDATLNAWRGLTERTGRGLMLGGMRSLEVTARRRGELVYRPDGSAHRVELGGTHAHLHVLAELAPGVVPEQLVNAWVAAADAEPWCQRPRVVYPSGPAIYQACKYPVDMAGLLDVLTAAPDYVRGVVEALHGRKVVSTFGSWRGVKLSGEEPGDGSVLFGNRAVVTLATAQPDDDDRVTWSDGSSTPALEVLQELLALGSLAQSDPSRGVRGDPSVAPVAPACEPSTKDLGPIQVALGVPVLDGEPEGCGQVSRSGSGHTQARQHRAKL